MLSWPLPSFNLFHQVIILQLIGVLQSGDSVKVNLNLMRRLDHSWGITGVEKLVPSPPPVVKDIHTMFIKMVTPILTTIFYYFSANPDGRDYFKARNSS